jgi:VCBS repeat-containing protein
VAVADSFTTAEDVALSPSAPGLLANDSDVDAGTALAILNPGTYAIGFGTVYANITVQSNGDYTLALDNAAVQSLGQGQSLRQAFFYTVSDGYVATPPALPSDRAFGTLDITIEGANDAPVTLADTAGVTEDVPLTASGNVLANDSDVDQGTTLAVGTPGTFAGAYGTLAISVDGSYTYTLDNGAAAVQALREGQTALERFDYAASDGFTSTPGSLTVTVTGANDAPLAAADSASLQEDFLVTASGNVLVNDRDPDAGTVLAAVLMGSSAGAYGTLSLGSDGSYTYLLSNASSAVQGLHAGQVVTDTFAYAATDGLASSTSALTITITGANDAPFTAPDTASVGEDGVLSASGNVLGNDSDADAGTTLAVSNAGTYAGTYGTLTLGADGGYGYALNNGANAVQSLRAGQVVSDVFAYTASDGIVGTPGSLTVSVTGANDAPLLATPIADQSANAGAPFSFTFAANTFTDIDQGDVLSYRASLADGSPLPSWLSFDGATRTFTGTPPGGGGDGCGCDCGGGATTADIRVTATDLASASASDVFKLSVSGGGDGGGGRLIVGTAGNDVLTGTACDDVIDGRQGGDTMSGGKGDDTYFVDQSCASGHGNEGVGNGEDPPPPGHDYNQNDGPGTSPGNPGSSPYNGSSQGGSDCSGPGCVADLVVEKANEGYDTVYASVDYTLPDNVEEVHLLGCDNLDATGNGLANVLEGNSGDNVLSGGAGADTYVYSLGGGKDVIDEKGAAGQTDTLKLQGMAASSVRLARSGNNLVVDFPGRDGRVTLKDWFSSSANRVERFQFDDGTVWDEAKIRSQVGKKVAPVYGDSSPVSYPDQRRADDCHGSSSGGDPHDDGCGSSRYDDTCRSDTDEAILRRLRQPVSFSFDEIMQALGDTGPTLSAAEIARRWAAARSYFCDDGDCHDSQADAFPSLKDLGLSLASQTGCGFGFEGSTGEQGSCGGMQSFQGLSEGFRRL